MRSVLSDDVAIAPESNAIESPLAMSKWPFGKSLTVSFKVSFFIILLINSMTFMILLTVCFMLRAIIKLFSLNSNGVLRLNAAYKVCRISPLFVFCPYSYLFLWLLSVWYRPIFRFIGFSVDSYL